jgi:outer membrane protein OmpA-like peptidoglycan-associated protein
VNRNNLKLLVAVAFCVGVAALGARAQSKDVEGSKDHPLISRYPGSFIRDYRTTDFDEFTLPLGKASGGVLAKSQHLEGKITYIDYATPPERSDLEVYRNYEAALKTAGFATLFACAHNDGCGISDLTLSGMQGGKRRWMWDSERILSAKLARPEGDVYLCLEQSANGNHYVALFIIEPKPMESGLVTVDAAALQGGLAKVGHVEVPGIFFDFNKSDVKPESKPALDEVAKMLKANPSMRVWVVGHTDSVGTIDANMQLSGARAADVAKALVANYGISATRLKGYGVGPLAPVASNDSEEGRAKNRRVELVKQ